ncbi:MAG: Quinoprotein ethanol dehydrogenase [Myxococcaceae bacterium]|nr:Quinoprotein ethanol dehydrogenase [Myxococcaceae bacterium]
MLRVISVGGLGCVLALGLLAGCSDDPAPATDSGVAADTGAATDNGTTADTGVVPDAGAATDVPATGAPTVAVTTPAANANLPVGAPTQLALAIGNFTLTNFIGTTGNQAGRGHVHVYLDANDNNDYLVADYIERPRVVIPNGTSLGAHTLRVSLRNNDHTPLSPPVQTTVSFTAVMNTAPSVTITSPADNSTVMAGADVTMALAFMNFTSRDFMNQTGVMPPNGHYHVYLDGASGSDYLIATHVPNPVVRIPAATTAGPHRLTISLRNDDHSEIVGSAVDLRIVVTR